MKAQLFQESQLDPNAVSPVGAEGLGQAMPGTWRDITKALGWPMGVSRRDAAYAIEGATWYQGRQRYIWRRNRTPYEANDPGLASYNAGTGNVLKAQKACGNARLWHDIAPCMEAVTGFANAKQTRDYVERIHGWRAMMGAP